MWHLKLYVFRQTIYVYNLRYELQSSDEILQNLSCNANNDNLYDVLANDANLAAVLSKKYYPRRCRILKQLAIHVNNNSNNRDAVNPWFYPIFVYRSDLQNPASFLRNTNRFFSVSHHLKQTALTGNAVMKNTNFRMLRKKIETKSKNFFNIVSNRSNKLAVPTNYFATNS